MKVNGLKDENNILSQIFKIRNENWLGQEGEEEDRLVFVSFGGNNEI